MTRFARRQDKNHSPIIDAYEKLGVSVVDLSRAAEVCVAGLPDLVCALHGYMFFSETKTDIGNLNPAQLHFMEIWKAPVKVVRTVDDVVAVVNEIKLLTGAGRYVKKTPHE